MLSQKHSAEPALFPASVDFVVANHEADWARKALAIQTKPESGFNKCTFQEIDLDDHE